MNTFILVTFATVVACVSASGLGTYVDGYGGAVVKGPSRAITSHEIPGTISYGASQGAVTGYGPGNYGAGYNVPIGYDIGTHGGSYGINHGPGSFGGYRAIPTVVTGPQTHAVITGAQNHAVVTAPRTSAVISGPKTDAVITGPLATADIRGPQSYTVLTAPAATEHERLNQNIGYGYGLAHAGVIPTVVTGPQTHAVITGPKTHAVISGPKTHAVISGPLATAETRGPQSHTVLAAPVAANVAVGHGILNQGFGYGYGLGHGGAIGSGHGYAGNLGNLRYGAGITNEDGYMSAGHQGAIVKGPRTVPAVIDGRSGKVYADRLWGPTTQGLGGYAHGW